MQRTQPVLRLLSKEEPAAQIARRAGISEHTLNRWRDKFLQGGAAAKELAKLQGELAERDQVIREITIANRIVKKLLDVSICFRSRDNV